MDDTALVLPKFCETIDKFLKSDHGSPYILTPLIVPL